MKSWYSSFPPFWACASAAMLLMPVTMIAIGIGPQAQVLYLCLLALWIVTVMAIKQ